ncbi:MULTISPECIES: amidohydrolase family protein [unclassified Saccharothrix]|uniref:amidohydrolase family protein n=1 Tax=unclassified Saccharothrix TaxID=2593673 RepID=UPI00307F6668
MNLVDMHVHFMPERVLDKVWSYFDAASEHYGVSWPIHYRLPEAERLAALRSFGVVGFAPLVYAHKPGMAEWLTEWALEFGTSVPEAVPTGTFFPEPGASGYVSRALSRGARCFKAHVQVGSYDPRDQLLDDVWGLLAEAAVPVVVHCGHGPIPGSHTGLDVFEEVLKRHPALVAVVAHAGMPDYSGALDLVSRYDGVHLDTTMVGVPFTEAQAALPRDWASRLVDVSDRVVLGSDFPNIPYEYRVQLDAIESWAAADDRLGADFLRAVLHDNAARLLRL